MKKETFFEILGELDDNIVKGTETPMKRNVNWKIWGTVATCLAVIVMVSVSMLHNGFITNYNETETNTDNLITSNTISLKPVFNFEGIVTNVENGKITLEDGKIIIIAEDTLFMGDPDTGNAVSEDILPGNFIQGYTNDPTDAAEITAANIWTNMKINIPIEKE